MADYALVKIKNAIETIDNIIVANPGTASSYLVANGGNYDYVLDTSLYSPIPMIGYTYNSGSNTFSPPAPSEDFSEEVEDKILEIHEVLQGTLVLASDLDASDLSNALSVGISNITADFTPNESSLFSSISAYISEGG